MATSDLYFDSLNEKTDSSKYFGYSLFFHTSLLIGALFVSVPVLQKINEPITIEIEESPTQRKILPLSQESLPEKGVIQKESQGPTLTKMSPTAAAIQKISAQAAAPLDATEVSEVVKAPVAKSMNSKSKVASLKTTTGKGSALKATSAASRAGVPETLEDIAAPDLDFDSVEVAQAGALGEDEFENEFKNVDHKSEAAVQALKSNFDNETEQLAAESDQALKSIADDMSAEAQAMEDSLEKTRSKNAAVLAQARASEEALRQKALANAAAEKAAAENARKQALAKQNGQGAQGQGLDRFGKTSTASNVQTGTPNGVRHLESLRQLPGNPKPKYSMDERLRREQGQVIFHAFVTPDGKLQNFKLIQSTGFKNLDQKTLAALQKWKFYPGQQGWVEIPQVWNLKGEAEEMPTLLRRQASK